MKDDAYEKLIAWLVRTFRALPGIDSPEFRDLIYFSYTPEEARLVVQMGPEGGKLDELVTRTGMKKEDLAALFDSMKEKGTLYIEPGSDNPIYRPLGMELPGLIETQAYRDPSNPFMKKIFELWGKLKPIYVGEGIAGLGKHAMPWCLVGVLPQDAKPEENLYEQLKKSEYITVTKCPCRQIEHHGHEGAHCDCIMECCMPLEDFGRFAVGQGYARRITFEEAVKILDACAEKGQMLQATPGLVICNCCKHGCINLYAQKLGKSHIFTQNHFYAVCERETCISCGACIERCPVDAIRLDDDEIAVIDQTKCIGCGSCAMGCAVRSIKMVRRSEEEIARIDGELVESVGKMMTMVTLDPIVVKSLSEG